MIARRDPEADWLPHCIHCDGRHLNSEPCVTNFQAVGAKTETDGKLPRSGPAASLKKGHCPHGKYSVVNCDICSKKIDTPISVGFRHTGYVFKNFRELEIFMGEHGFTKDDIDWFDDATSEDQP